MKQKMQFDGISILTPPDWFDITDDLEGESVPFTVARGEHGVGALQFSTALYSSGKDPAVTLMDLLELLEDFRKKRGLASGREQIAAQEGLKIAAASFPSANQFLRVWYGSDGKNLVFVTYTSSANDDFREEVIDSDEIVKSIRFAGKEGG